MSMAEPSKAKAGISTRDTQKIERRFKEFLRNEEHGIPRTLAGQRGVAHLLARPYARGNPPRPSFIDTGLYMDSFRVWVEEED